MNPNLALCALALAVTHECGAVPYDPDAQRWLLDPVSDAARGWAVAALTDAPNHTPGLPGRGF